MNTDLLAILAILVVGVLRAGEIVGTFVIGLRWLREINRTQQAIAGLVVQESEQIQNLMRA